MKEIKVIKPISDNDSIIRNPAMGWVLYIDAFSMYDIQEFPDAKDYWDLQDKNVHMASTFYLRVPWSIMEPEEGKYAWDEDENFKLMIQMALDRGLKLAFRVYVDSRDAFMQATPQYVFDAGAIGYSNNEENDQYLTPFLYDEVFQEKLGNFVRAFAGEYDDPSIVDYIDAQGLGFWGEMHSTGPMTIEQKKDVFEWITNLYGTFFKNVLLGQQYGNNDFDKELQDWALEEKGYVIRRDSFGSPLWLKPSDKQDILEHWPNVPVFAENCYHGFKWREEWYQEDGFASLYDMMKTVVRDAEELHANTLDLRYPQDASLWTEKAPDLVRDFALRSGYRFALELIEYPSEIDVNKPYLIKHRWKNNGFGMLPNNNRNWRFKYKPAFALINKITGKIEFQMTDETDPSQWVGDESFDYASELIVEKIQAGHYDLAVAIINTENESKPEINLAIKNEVTENGWSLLGSVTVN